MKKIIKYNYIVLLAMFFLIFSCEKDDYTDHSTLKPTKPTITISGIDAGGYNFVEQDTSFTFDVTLSTAQISDIVLYITQISGNATMGDDYKLEKTKVTISAYTLSTKVKVFILSDDLKEETETFKLQIGDERTANANITPVTVEFTIGNATSPSLVADLSWETDVLDAIGLDLDPDEVADLRLVIIDVIPGETDTIVAVVDGGSFETYSGFNTLHDGDYIIAADFYSTINAGDYNEIVTIDLELIFNQSGVINDTTFNFPAAMTNATPCSAYRTNLATVNKAGSTFTLVKDVSYSWSAELADLAGGWNGVDASTVLWDEPSQVSTTVNGTELEISGLGYGWMYNFWGEEVISSNTINLVFDWEVHGAVSIPQQAYIITLYDGSEYPYDIVGTGTFNTCGKYPELVFEYDMLQDGWSTAGWCYANGYLTTELFVAKLTLDPSGKWKATNTGNTKMCSKKPTR
ncbi:MAG: hypothetical protein KAT68_14895 [Bacteroidales bacterium]|nr:hypothetical protein [Bacteroidales bacterium]